MTPPNWSNTRPSTGADKQTFVGKKPNKVIPVPREYRCTTLRAERESLVNDIQTNTGCTVIPHWDRETIYQFDVFGSGASSEKAIRLLNHWISKANVKSKASSAWAKMRAFNHGDWYSEQVEVLEQERKEKFKGPMPETPEGGGDWIRGIVTWPESLSNQSRSPRDVFGNKLESLDSLRMKNDVYITLLPLAETGVWRIAISSAHDFSVETAKEDLLTMIQKVHAEALGLNNSLNIMLDEAEGIDIVLESAGVWWPNRQDFTVPRLLSAPTMDSPGEFKQNSLSSKQLSQIEHSFHLALEAVRQKKGAYDLSIRLGCLALRSTRISNVKIGEVHEKDAFLKSIDGFIELDIKKWLAEDKDGQRILRRLISAGGFLEPTKSAGYFGITPPSLASVRPMFRGTWVFRDPNSAVPPPRTPIRHPGRPALLDQQPIKAENISLPVEIYVVQVDWTEDELGEYEKSAPRYYKLEKDNLGPKRNMDINLLELGESRGWSFALESLIPVPSKSVPPTLTGFAQQAKMKPHHDISSKENFADWAHTPTVMRHLQTGRLDAIYSFGIRETCFKVELTRMWYPQKQPVWGLAVRHAEWATHLAHLEHLSLGGRADWSNDTVRAFLPEDGQMSSVQGSTGGRTGDGVRLLTDKLMQISAMVSSDTDGMGALGGMESGSVAGGSGDFIDFE